VLSRELGFEMLGVVDLRGGLAVRARGGRRDTYLPIDKVAGESIPPGDATALKRQYLDRFGLSALYVADLDAIEHHTPQHAIVRSIAAGEATVWLDAAIASLDDARLALACGASRLIVGLETLPSFEVLESIGRAVGRERVVFSLDLRDGQPISTTPELAQQSPEDLAARAADAGVSAMLMLDLARVGSRSGVDLELLARIRSSVSTIPLYAGGGVRSIGDVEQLRQVGCDGALVATALLDGQITKRDLDRYLSPTPSTYS
jgi:phosphoribosylformimino-5-aminoimidazole carboxamide ribotide isomerase